MGFIYKITNKVNGKIYVGQTTHPVRKRWLGHLSHARTNHEKSCTHLHRAIRKYGAKNFTCEVLQEIDNSFLDEFEKFWIQSYDSAHKGYNITLGGEGSMKFTDAEILEKWNEGLTVKQIAKSLGSCKPTISERLHALGIDKRILLERGWENGAKKNRIPVYQYDLDGNYLRSFDSIKDANVFIGLKNGVTPALNGTIQQAGGYLWKDYKADKIEPYKPIKAQRRRVAKIAEDGTVLEVFQKIKDAATSVNGNHANIVRACKNPHKVCCGYHWRYV